MLLLVNTPVLEMGSIAWIIEEISLDKMNFLLLLLP